MKIGVLTGAITLEDQVTSKLGVIANNIRNFAERAEGSFGAMAIGVGAVTAAVVGAGASIVALGTKGSTILGVEDSFNRLAVAIGSTGEALLGGLDAGVRGTIDSMVLMQSTTRLLSSGVKLTADDMRVMGATAREMGKATGTDATTGLNQLSMAMLTGNQRSLKRFGIQVDLVEAEENFAKSLGTTRDQLNAAGRLEAARIAMLEGMRNKLQTLGESQLSFKERVQQANVAIGNWFDNLAKGVASSPAVNTAFDSIRDSLVQTFGSSSQTLLETIIGWVDKFATAVGNIGPMIISWMGKVRDAIVGVWNWMKDLNERYQITQTIVTAAQGAWELLQSAFNLVRDAVVAVINAWKAMPEWLQRITKSALESALVLTAYSTVIAGLSMPVMSVVETLDLGINMVGNFTTAIFNIVNLSGTWAASATKVTAAYHAMTAATIGSTLATNASTAANNFWNGSSLVMGARLAAATALTYAADAADKIAAASKAAYAAAMNFLGTSAIGMGARLAIGTAATGAATVASGAATAATIAFGTAINVLTFAVTKLLAPLAALYAGLKLGSWLEKNTKWARALSDAFQYAALRWQGFTAAQANAAIAADHAREALQKQAGAVDELAQSQARLAAEQAKQRREKLTGQDTANEVHQLRMDFLSLSKAQQEATTTMDRVGQAASDLRKQGGRLHPELKTLADRWDENQKKALRAGSEFINTGKSMDEARTAALRYQEELKDIHDTLSGKKLADEVEKFNEAIGDLKDFDPRGLQRIGDQAERMHREGAVLTGVLMDVFVAQGRWHRGLIDLNPNIGRTTGSIEDFNEKMERTRDIAIGVESIVGKDLMHTMGRLPGVIDLIGKHSTDVLPQLGRDLKAAQAATEQWRSDLGELARGFELMANIAGDSFGGIVKDLANVISSWNLAEKAAAQYEKAQTKAAHAAAIMSGIGAVAQATGQGSTGSRALGGALTGFTVGNAILPGVGGVIGGVAGGLLGLFRGNSAAKKAAEEARQQIAALAAETQKLREEYIQTAGGIETLAQRAFTAGTSLEAMLNAKTPQEYKTAIDELNAALEFQDSAMKLLDETAAKYGLTLAEMGPKYAQGKLNEQFQQLYQDQEVLLAGGVNYDLILKKQASSYVDLITQAIKAGATIPLEMKPAIDRMIELGLFTDEAGKAMVDVTKLKFAETLDSKFQTLITSIQDLVDAIARGLSGALVNLPKPDAPWADWPDPPGVPNYHMEPADWGNVQTAYHSRGGVVKAQPDFTPRGTDTVPAMLTPGERVLSVNENKQYERGLRGSGGDLHITLKLENGKVIAREVVPFIPEELRRLGVA